MSGSVIERTANLAWSPKKQYPILLAAGTAAQQLDASFSTSASLEIFSVNLDNQIHLEKCFEYKSDYRFHKLVWEDYIIGDDNDKGIIAGGCDAGKLLLYNAGKKENPLIACLDRHSGPVRALDFNSFQKNLLATGASESEIFIWDLKQLSTPMTPGAAAQPSDDIKSLAWNKQVQHILATTFSTRCIVWDLRKNEPIIKLTDTTSKIRWKVVSWNPDFATQLCLASEEDQYPVIQMWDLRFATSPIKVFEGHEKGVLSTTWCNDDSDLLISCGKDDKILVWNPNNPTAKGEIVGEYSTHNPWNFEAIWCPRNPFLVACSSYGRASVYSLNGRQSQLSEIVDSFSGNQFPAHQQQPSIELLKPPKWVKKPQSVSFGFGGKLISYSKEERNVYVSQIISEPDLDLKFKELEFVLEQGNKFLYDHCLKKVDAASDPYTKNVWNFIASQFYGESFKNQMYFLLGTSQPSLQEKLSNLNITDESLSKTEESINDPFSNASHIGPADEDDIFDNLAARQNSSANATFRPPKQPLKIIQSNDVDGAISDALLLGNIELAVDLCLKEGKMADAIILAMSGGPELIAKTQTKYFEKSESYLTTLISAVVTEDWCNIVEICDLSNWKQVLVALLTYTRNDEFRSLCELLGQRLQNEGDESLRKNALICYVCAGNVNLLIENWKSDRTNSADDIQELAELGLVVKEALKARGIDIEVTGAIANILVQYAELLTSQGYLKEAYSYLGESQEENILMLKDRLMCALGLRSPYPAKPDIPAGGRHNYFQPQQISQPQASYMPQYPTGPAASNLYNPPMPAAKSYGAMSQPPPLPQTANVMPPPLTATKPILAPPLPTPVSQMPPVSPGTKSVNAFPTQQIPSLPVNAGPPPISNHISSTPNFFTPQPQGGAPIVPTLYSSSAAPLQPPAPTPPSPFIPSQPAPHTTSALFSPTSTTQFQFNNMGASLPPPPVASNMGPPPSAARTTPTPPAPPPTSQVPYNSSRQTPDHVLQSKTKYVLDPSVRSGGYTSNTFQNSAASFPSMPGMPPNPVPFNQPPSSFPAPQNEPSPFPVQQNHTMFYPSQPGSNPYFSNSHIPNPIQHPPMPDIPKMPTLISSAPGWNDPPSVSYEKTSSNQANFNAPHNPITHPLYGSAVPEDNPVNRPPSVTNNVNPMKPPVGNYGVTNSYHNNVVPNQPPEIQAPPVAKPKAALPEQHIHMQTVFDELRNQCFNKTNNPQMKRKLEDVARKLEVLYDAIRESRISQATLNGLHEIVKTIQHGNYQGCLSLHTQLVSGPDFSTIASFMPGIKVLVQSALQLDVYI